VVGGALTAAVAAAVLVVALASWNGADETPNGLPRPGGDSGIEAAAGFSPRAALFGDTVQARVDVVLDPTRIDARSVRVAADFTPWQAVGKPERVQRDVGDMAHVRTTFVLRCLTGSCVLTGPSARLEFEDARISFEETGDTAESVSSLRTPWPTLLVYPRFAASNIDDGPGGGATAWRADVVTLPEASYRFDPGVLFVVLLVVAGIAAIAGVALAYAAWPRRAPAPLPEPEPELPVGPELSPLEQALALLEESVRSNGAEGQRRALELVAEELELAEWGDPDLARTARVLAWSEGVPPPEQTVELAARVRATLPEPEQATDNGGGHVV
jgi:hypothetical protein